MPDRRHALVIGAGPVGLVAALALDAAGVSPLVIEAEPEDRLRPGSRATFIARQNLDLLDEVVPGLREEIASRGLQWTKTKTYFRRRLVHTMTFRPAPPGKRSANIAQKDTEQILLRIAREKGIPFQWGSPVRKVKTSADGVLVELESGDVFEAEYAIGADGARSTTRKQLGIEMEGEVDDLPFIIVDAAAKPDGSTGTNPAEFHYESPELDGRNVLWAPFTGGLRIDLQCKQGDDAEYMGTPEGAREWMNKILDPWYGDNIAWISTYRFFQLVAKSFTDENHRVMLVGEAAHLFSPFGGRGLNSGIVDAVHSARAIARALAAPSRADAERAIADVAEDRRLAAQFNRDSAVSTLRVMQASTASMRIKRRLAAGLSGCVPRLGLWLAQTPLGPTGGRPGAESIF